MFENLREELRRLAASPQVSVPIESDAEGYLDKECPAEACLFQFNWQILEKVYCQNVVENLKPHTEDKSPYAVHETVILHCDIPRNSTSIEKHAEYKDPHEDAPLRKLFFCS